MLVRIHISSIKEVPPTWHAMQVKRRSDSSEQGELPCAGRWLGYSDREPDALTRQLRRRRNLLIYTLRWLGWEISFAIYFFAVFLACDFVLVWPIFGDFLALLVLVVSVFFTFFVSSLIVFLYVGLFVFLSSVHLSFSHVVLLSFCPSVLHCHCPPVLPFYYTTQAQSVSVTKGNPFLKCVGSIKWALSK